MPLTNDGETECLGLLAMWLVLESPRDTLINLAVWLEIQDSLEADASEVPPSDQDWPLERRLP